VFCREEKIVRSVHVFGWLAGIAMCATSFAQNNTNEIEPNDDKAHATVVAAMAPSDTLTGNSTGGTTLNDSAAGSADYWNITTTAAGAPGIYDCRLTINESTSTGHTLSIRGLTQTAGAINVGTDAQLQNCPPGTSHFLKWYSNEQPSHLYVEVIGTPSTTTNYVITFTRTLITPVVVPNPVDAGPVFITTIGQTTVDTDMWLYDSNLNPIALAGNDQESVAGGGPGNTNQSRLQRNLAPGSYYVALARSNLANNMASPSDDRNMAGGVTDFGNVACTTSVTTGSLNLNFVIGNRCTGVQQTVSDTISAGFLVVSFASFTVSGTQLPDPTTFSAAAASPASVTQGTATSTLLTVTATGPAPASVTADLSAFGLSSAVAFHDDGLNGDAVAGDGIWSYNLPISASQALGAYTINVTAPAGSCGTPSAAIAFNVAPVNNSCSSAVPISVGGAYPGSTIGALAAGGLTTNCNSVPGNSPGVWYTFTETSLTPRRLIATVCDPVTNFNAKLLLYTLTNPANGCGSGNFTCVWGNFQPGFGCPYQNPARDPGSTVSNARTDIPAIINWSSGQPAYKPTTPGTTYYICVENEGAASGNFVLHLDDTGEDPVYTNPPNNDLCSGGRDLASFQSGVPVHTGFPVWDLVFRDHATDDAKVSCSDPTNTVSRAGTWYTFTPSTNGNLFHAKIPDQVATGVNQPAGSSFDTVVTVFTGDCASGLTEVACVDAVEGFSNMFTTAIASLTGGTTYHIEVSNQSPTAAIPAGEYLGFNFVSTGPSPCCRSDFNGDGDIGTDLDIESFFACLAGDCCPTCPPTADFNCDGDIGTDTDIESFFRVLAGGAC
jgi:hypothetical protein